MTAPNTAPPCVRCGLEDATVVRRENGIPNHATSSGCIMALQAQLTNAIQAVESALLKEGLRRGLIGATAFETLDAAIVRVKGERDVAVEQLRMAQLVSEARVR